MGPLHPRAARIQAEVSARDAASELGVSTETLRRYENGSRAPRASTLAVMGDIYNLDDQGVASLAHWYAQKRRQSDER